MQSDSQKEKEREKERESERKSFLHNFPSPTLAPFTPLLIYDCHFSINFVLGEIKRIAGRSRKNIYCIISTRSLSLSVLPFPTAEILICIAGGSRVALRFGASEAKLKSSARP
jgi:hypothetical protein